MASSVNPGYMGISLPLPMGLDKMVHVFEFGILTLLLWWPLRAVAPSYSKLKLAALLLIFVAANGIIDEFHQSFIPGRDSSWADAAADFLGGSLGIAWILHRLP